MNHKIARVKDNNTHSCSLMLLLLRSTSSEIFVKINKFDRKDELDTDMNGFKSDFKQY